MYSLASILVIGTILLGVKVAWDSNTALAVAGENVTKQCQISYSCFIKGLDQCELPSLTTKALQPIMT